MYHGIFVLKPSTVVLPIAFTKMKPVPISRWQYKLGKPKLISNPSLLTVTVRKMYMDKKML